MVIVVFEFYVNINKGEDYFLEVEKLQDEIKNARGFLGVERFESKTTEGYYVSVSSWKDEESVNLWHKNPKHLVAQSIGKKEIFKSFRIRVANVIRDYSSKETRKNITTA